MTFFLVYFGDTIVTGSNDKGIMELKRFCERNFTSKIKVIYNIFFWY